jgi:hypothetical protein
MMKQSDHFVAAGGGGGGGGGGVMEAQKASNRA